MGNLRDFRGERGILGDLSDVYGPKIQKNKILKNFKKYYIIYIEKRKENP